MILCDFSGKGECSTIFQDMFVCMLPCLLLCAAVQVEIPLAGLPTELLIFIKIFCKCFTSLALLSSV